MNDAEPNAVSTRPLSDFIAEAAREGVYIPDEAFNDVSHVDDGSPPT
jgi:hypothetical protein